MEQQTKLSIIVFLLTLKSVECRQVDPKKCQVWGPGLNGAIMTPVRYFFIQAFDTKGIRFNETCGEDCFSVSIMTAENGRVRVHVEVLDRRDGVYIVRYLLHESPLSLKITVKFRDKKHIGDSPYLLDGPVYHEYCRCPHPDISAWLADMQCPSSWRQIDADLSHFPTVNVTYSAPLIRHKFRHAGSHSLCHYKILNNRIYLKTQGQHVGFRMFSDQLLLSLSRKVRLPDAEFFVNLGDWPLVKRTSKSTDPLPMFSWCGSHDTWDIVMPTYDLMEATFSMMSRVTLDILSAQANTGPRWEEKTPKGFWRGRDSRQERLDLVVLSREHPDEIDAALTHMFFFPQNDKKYGALVEPVSFFDFFQYKYQVTVDGTVAAYRLPYLLAGDALVLKQDSPYYEHFYNDLKPWVHYVPFRRDLSDLRERLGWARDHDAKARLIAENAREFVNDNLLPQQLLCYYVTLFQEYSKRLISPVVLDESFEEVKDDATDTYNNYKCQCHRSNVKREKRRIRDDL